MTVVAAECLTSLDTYAYLSHDESDLDRCPRKAHLERLNVDTGERRPVRCRANWCPFCGPQNAWLAGGAMGLAQPQRFGTVTLVGNDWPTIQRRMNWLASEMRQADPTFRWVYAVEPNPQGTGHHAHFWQRGEYVSKRRFDAACRRFGTGYPFIKPWVNRAEVISYGVKLEGISYGTKSTREAYESMRGFLGINGGRLVHASQGFFRHEAHPGQWRTLTQREAMTAFLHKRHPELADDHGRWRVIGRTHEA